GRKLMCLYCFLVFSLGSLGCALSGGLWTLICARALQAVGAAMLQANSIALVATSSPANRLRSALGIQAAAQSVGLAIGPTVGGVVVSTLGWRWVFLVNLPVGVVALALGFFLLPRTRQLALSGGVGAAGFILFAATTAALLLGLSTAAGLGFRPWEVAVLLGSAVVLGAVFVSNQRRVQNPLLDLVLLLSPGVGLGLLGALGAYLVLFGPLVLVPVVLSAEGFTALHAGLVATALPAGFALGALSVNGWRPPAWSDLARFTAGSALSCAALAAAVIAPLRPGWIVAVLAVMGLGLGVAIPANNAMIMRCIPPAGSGTGGGLINMARGLGTAMGVALVTLCLHLGGIGGPHHGARLAWAVLTAASLAMVVSCRRPPATS
ncbi:MAG: MFS transporter, partial [Acidimicrobiales bacterium]